MARKGNDSLTAQAKGYCGSSLELSLSLSRSPNVTGVRDATAGSSASVSIRTRKSEVGTYSVPKEFIDGTLVRSLERVFQRPNRLNLGVLGLSLRHPQAVPSLKTGGVRPLSRGPI
jgi:hypothetical protein